MTLAYLSLGSNIGDRAAHLSMGLEGLMNLPQTRLRAVSALYETEPVGPVAQGPFFNICAEIDTWLTPHALLHGLLAIEVATGRSRRERWGPRTLDIDILVFGDERIEEEELSLPHPRLSDRAFVLMPLADIAPDLVVEGTSVRHRLGRLDTRGVMRRGKMPKPEAPQ